jgi:hypothetical protein
MPSSKDLEFFLVACVLAGLVFFSYVSLKGVPIAWLLFPPVPGTAQNQLSVSVSPEVPAFLGEQVAITVRDRQTGAPVGGAIVSISKDGDHLFDLTTDGSGETSFKYPGETTILIVSGGAYIPQMKVIPGVPGSWIRETAIGIFLGIVSGAAVVAISKRYLTD